MANCKPQKKPHKKCIHGRTNLCNKFEEHRCRSKRYCPVRLSRCLAVIFQMPIYTIRPNLPGVTFHTVRDIIGPSQARGFPGPWVIKLLAMIQLGRFDQETLSMLLRAIHAEFEVAHGTGRTCSILHADYPPPGGGALTQ